MNFLNYRANLARSDQIFIVNNCSRRRRVNYCRIDAVAEEINVLRDINFLRGSPLTLSFARPYVLTARTKRTEAIFS